MRALLLALCLACAAPSAPSASLARRPVTGTGLVPLTDLAGTYHGFPGGLYGDGTNVAPPAHLDSAMAAAARVIPPSGRYVVLSIGFSNWAQEFCCAATLTANPAPTPESFLSQARADTAVRREIQALFNGAMAKQTNPSWDQPTDAAYDVVRSRLAQRNLTEVQVRVVLLKVATLFPTRSLPDPAADAYQLMASTGAVIRALRVRYPNLQQVYLVPRIYAGYAGNASSPEPYAYETAFAVQQVVQAQIAQHATGQVDPRVGDVGRPWVGWGPYLWADGLTPRSDGLTWARAEFQADGIHPSPAGVQKVGGALLAFLSTTPHAACWFLAAGTC